MKTKPTVKTAHFNIFINYANSNSNMNVTTTNICDNFLIKFQIVVKKQSYSRGNVR